MPRIIALLILLVFVATVLPNSGVCIQDDAEKNWSDLSDKEKEAIRAEILRKYDSKDIPFRDWLEYTVLERQQLRERWTEVEVELIAESLRFGEELPSFVNKFEFSKEDKKLLKELGITAFDHRIKNYDLRGINLESEDLSNINLNVINLQGSRLRGANLSGSRGNNRGDSHCFIVTFSFLMIQSLHLNNSPDCSTPLRYGCLVEGGAIV